MAKLGLALILTLLPLSTLAQSPKKSVKTRIEIETDEIEGEPMIIESSSYFNWRGACRDWMSSTKGGRIVEANCGTPSCTLVDYEIVCSSSASKRIEYIVPSEPTK